MEKKNYLIFAALISTIVLCVFIYFSQSKNQIDAVNKKETKKIESKVNSKMISHQTLNKRTNQKMIKRKIILRDVNKKGLIPKVRGLDPLDAYIDEKVGKYGIATKLFALPKNIKVKDKESIVSTNLSMNWINSEIKPNGSYTVVKDEKTGMVGFYTGKIVILTQSKEEIKSILMNDGLNYQQISSSIIVDVNDFKDAHNYILKLQKNFPQAKIDFDLNFSRREAH